MTFSNHVVTRVSPHRQPFVGKCIKCGKEGMTLADAREQCDGKMSNDSALVAIIEGKTEA